ncbi:MAG: ATP-binding cassette domain-containing protein [Pseudomonadota bacterium]
MISLTGVSKSFGSVRALAPTTLSFAPGRTTVVIGPSGCGKTTLLRLMLGLTIPDSGSVALDGEMLTQANVDTLRHRVGYVIQDGALFPHLTAKRNVTLMARFLGRSRDEIERRCSELAALARIPVDLLARYPRELSGGQRQRVALMRALMLDPPALLMDEPLGALDPMTRHALQVDLKSIFARLGKTVVLVTHDMHEAAHFADEIVMMREGTVIQRGTLDDLLARPAEPFVTEFIRAQRADPRLTLAPA